MTDYVIGDIQGCFDEFIALLDALHFDRQHDHIYLCGDLVNRGPQSLAVLRHIFAHSDCMSTILGNHEWHLMASGRGVNTWRGNDDTFADVLTADDRDTLVNWLIEQPLFRHLPNGGVLVHAGIPPQWTVSDAARYADEVHHALTSAPDAFLATMYGNKPKRWSPELGGDDRWRYIVNAMTRMRYCAADGELLLDNSTRDRYQPWFSHANRQSRDTTIYFGHWAALGLHHADNTYCLDGGCVWGGELCAIALDTHTVTRVPAARSYRTIQ